MPQLVPRLKKEISGSQFADRFIVQRVSRIKDHWFFWLCMPEQMPQDCEFSRLWNSSPKRDIKDYVCIIRLPREQFFRSPHRLEELLNSLGCQPFSPESVAGLGDGCAIVKLSESLFVGSNLSFSDLLLSRVEQHS